VDRRFTFQPLSAPVVVRSEQGPPPQLVVRKLLKRATLAQLVERLIRNQQVAGSIPAGGSIFFNNLTLLDPPQLCLGSQLGSHRAQKSVHRVGGLLAALIINVLVDGLGKPNISVPKDVLNNLV
jgi:hypothetical protein